jgi:hypothetical protein
MALAKGIVSWLAPLAFVVATGAQPRAASGDGTPNQQRKAAFDRGVKLLNQGNFEQALAELQKARGLTPNPDEVLDNISRCYEGLHEQGPALQALKEALQVVRKPPKAPAPVEITFVYSTEKEDWISQALADFRQETAKDFSRATDKRQSPLIVVRALAKGSFQAAVEIGRGDLRPDLWSPADSVALKIAEAERSRNLPQLPPFGTPKELAYSPLVFVTWKERAAQLFPRSSGTDVEWEPIGPSLEDSWTKVIDMVKRGHLRVGHTDPFASNSGLQTIGLLSNWDAVKHLARVPASYAATPAFREFIVGVEERIDHCEQSTKPLLDRMTRFRKSPFDGAFVYENLARYYGEHRQGKQPPLVIVQPKPTYVSDHPIVIIDWVPVKPGAKQIPTPQAQAAKKLMTFLLTKQKAKISYYGFRTAAEASPIDQLKMDVDDVERLQGSLVSPPCTWE